MKVTLYGFLGNESTGDIGADPEQKEFFDPDNHNTDLSTIEWGKETDIEPAKGDYDPDMGGYATNMYLHIKTGMYVSFKKIWIAMKTDKGDTFEDRVGGYDWSQPYQNLSFTFNLSTFDGSTVTDLHVYILPINISWLDNENWKDPSGIQAIKFNEDVNAFYNENFRPEPSSIPFKITKENCTSSYNETTIKTAHDSMLVEEQNSDFLFDWQGVPTDITFKADNGYEFSETLKITDGSKFKEMNAPDLLEFTESFYPQSDDNFSVSIKAVKKVQSLSTFTRIYLIDKAKLNEISDERYIFSEDQSVLDYSRYIMSLYALPLEIADDQLNKNADMFLGAVKLDTKADQINKDVLTYDIGKISVPEKYKNSYDYQNVSCNLYAPFFDPIVLDPQDVVNNTLQLYYEVNMYNGNAILYVKSEKNEKIIYNTSKKIAQDIPYYLTNTDESVKSFSDQILKNTLQAFIIVKRDKIKHGKIKDFKGYNTFSNIQLKTNASLSEQTEILSQLQSGVYINE